MLCLKKRFGIPRLTHIFSINAYLKEGVEAAHHLVSEVIAEEIEQAKLGARQVLIFTFHPWFFSDDSLGRFSIAVCFLAPASFLESPTQP